MIINKAENEILNTMCHMGSIKNQPGIRIGTILSAAPDMVIDLGDGLQIDRDNILAFDGYTTLIKGDLVAVFPCQKNYLVLCKVVNLHG